MSESIKKLIFNQKIEYLFWGAMTTLVYFIARFASMIMTANAMIPVAVAQVISILFAFIVNKYLVFNTDAQSKSPTAQFVIFLIGRALAAALDFLLTEIMMVKFYKFFIKIMFLSHINYSSALFQLGICKKLFGDPILMNKFICVILIQVIIIIINYIVSKYFAFK